MERSAVQPPSFGNVFGFALDTNTNATVAFLAVPVYSGNPSSARLGETNFYSKAAAETFLAADSSSRRLAFNRLTTFGIFRVVAIEMQAS